MSKRVKCPSCKGRGKVLVVHKGVAGDITCRKCWGSGRHLDAITPLGRDERRKREKRERERLIQESQYRERLSRANGYREWLEQIEKAREPRCSSPEGARCARAEAARDPRFLKAKQEQAEARFKAFLQKNNIPPPPPREYYKPWWEK